ncbi:MAG: hypothetical protein ACNYNY_00815 [Candidatus Oxydemutatoraceae bacterium WSBS_2016_MAG_OTU14]
MHFGLLRISLWTLGILLVILAPEPGVPTTLEWPLIVPTLIAPAAVPLVFMVIIFDALMAKIFLSSTPSAQSKQRYKKIIFINLFIALTVIVAWFGFFASLNNS